jgi:diguanylate cyclase (GGDEF)-like protein/PAS domain S-box-containing protein
VLDRPIPFPVDARNVAVDPVGGSDGNARKPFYRWSLQARAGSVKDHWFEPPDGSEDPAEPTGSNDWAKQERTPLNLASIEEGLRLALDLSGADLVLCDPQTWRFVDCNQSAHARLGYSREEFLALEPALLQADAQHDERWVQERMEQMRRQPRGSFTTRHRGRDGHLRDVDLHYQMVDFQGRSLVVIALRDSTEKERARRESERLGIMLNAAERISHVGSWELIHATGELLWSEETYRIFATTPEATRPSYDNFLSLVHPDDRDALQATFRQSVLNGSDYRMKHRLLLPDGQVRIVLERGETRYDSKGEAITTFGTVHDITDQHVIERRLEEAAYLDPLTGLPNKAATIRRLHGLMQTGAYNSSIAVIGIDLDDFQSINDSFGPEVGNQVLTAVGQLLRDHLQTSDWVARLGSDEFVVVRHCPSGTIGEAINLARQVHGALDDLPLIGTGVAMRPTSCVGVATFPEHGTDPESLLQCANTALMEAKHSGKHQLRAYSTAMSTQLRERLELEAQLAHAVDREQLRLVYQPQVDRRAKPIGAEALLRWRSQGGQEVPPDRFIPLAEQTGLILPIGSWVLQEALRQVRLWHLRGMDPPRLAINISALQLEQEEPSLSSQLAEALRQHQVSAEAIELEITETALLRNPQQAVQQLEELAGLGFSLAIDDFGTGYSSLAILHALPINKLKIDRCFVQNIDRDDANRAIVRATISMARALGLLTLAEGVETQSQFENLMELGCDQFQGYLFGRPQPTEPFERTLVGLSGGQETPQLTN